MGKSKKGYFCVKFNQKWKIRLRCKLKADSRKLAVGHLRLLFYLSRGRSVSIRYWLFLYKIAKIILRYTDVLTPSYPVSRGAELSDAGLSGLLREDVLGEWSLSGRVIELLWRIIKTEKPKVIIECGSGISTLVFAHYALWAENRGYGPVRILSIEQNREIIGNLEKRFLGTKLSKSVEFLFAPLSSDGFYLMDRYKLEKALTGKSADLVLVDGPATDSKTARLQALIQLAGFCRPGARWFMDDAFRDGEMEMLKTGVRLDGLSVDGIYPLEKGLATGNIVNPQKLGRA